MTTWSDAKDKQLHWIETKGPGRTFELRTEEGDIAALLRAGETWTIK